MAGLFDPERHTALRPMAWDARAAAAAIQAIVSDAEAAFDPERGWPAHPQDDGLPDWATGLYCGSTGVLWAMDFLRREGAAEHGLDVAAHLPAFTERNRADFGVAAERNGMPARRAAYLFDESPMLLMAIRQASDGEPAQALFRRIETSLDLPPLELMWGFAGAMLACRFASEMTGDDRWRGLFQAQADHVLAELIDTDDGPIWQMDLYGRPSRYLGPVHGYAGNMIPLLRGWDWLTEAQRERIEQAIPATLEGHAQRDGDVVNWRPMASPGPQPVLVQHCHGAPGMVTALADQRVASPDLRELFAGAGQLTWRAGPLAKGSNLCHGTGGNGFAFLKLHRLGGEAVWLDRARAFAMHAIEQCRTARAVYGRGRYSLWTGDIGLACYLHECLRGTARFPTIDIF